jgi:hypothetical protein
MPPARPSEIRQKNQRRTVGRAGCPFLHHCLRNNPAAYLDLYVDSSGNSSPKKLIAVSLVSPKGRTVMHCGQPLPGAQRGGIHHVWRSWQKWGERLSGGGRTFVMVKAHKNIAHWNHPFAKQIGQKDRFGRTCETILCEGPAEGANQAAVPACTEIRESTRRSASA